MSKVVPISVDKLDQLAVRINREQAAAYGSARKAVEHAAECGRLLLNAKELVEHGEWLPWLEANTEVSPRQSQNYMKLAGNWGEIESKYEPSSHLTLTGALKLIAKPKAKPEPHDEPESGWHVIMLHTIGMTVQQGTYATKAEAEKKADEWRQNIAGLKRKPKGEIHVVTTAKLDAMNWSCSVTPDMPRKTPR